MLDDRYETLEGSLISIKDNYDIREKDVVIKGNTLVNCLGDITYIHDTTTTTFDKQNNTITIEHASGQIPDSSARFANSLVEPGKTYTLIFNIVENTLYRNEGNKSVGKFNIVSYDRGNYKIEKDDVGLKKIVLTQPDIATHNGKPYLEFLIHQLVKLW